MIPSTSSRPHPIRESAAERPLGFFPVLYRHLGGEVTLSAFVMIHS